MNSQEGKESRIQFLFLGKNIVQWSYNPPTSVTTELSLLPFTSTLSYVCPSSSHVTQILLLCCKQHHWFLFPGFHRIVPAGSLFWYLKFCLPLKIWDGVCLLWRDCWRPKNHCQEISSVITWTNHFWLCKLCADFLGCQIEHITKKQSFN